MKIALYLGDRESRRERQCSSPKAKAVKQLQDDSVTDADGFAEGTVQMVVFCFGYREKAAQFGTGQHFGKCFRQLKFSGTETDKGVFCVVKGVQIPAKLRDGYVFAKKAPGFEALFFLKHVKIGQKCIPVKGRTGCRGKPFIQGRQIIAVGFQCVLRKVSFYRKDSDEFLHIVFKSFTVVMHNKSSLYDR